MDNPYQSPTEPPTNLPIDGLADQPRSKRSYLLAVVAIGFSILVEVIIVATANRFSQLIEEFELEVSVVTQFALSPFLPVVVALVIVAAIGKEFVPACRLALNRFNLFVLLLGACFLAIYLVAIFAPLISLIQSLTS